MGPTFSTDSEVGSPTVRSTYFLSRNFLAAVTDVGPSDCRDAGFLAGLVTSAERVTIGEGERKVQDLRIARPPE